MCTVIQFYLVKIVMDKDSVSIKVIVSISLENTTPVSYTHLDVYKRQLQDCIQNII